MPGPGEYLPDATEGITRVEDLPKPKIVKRSRNFRRQPCPQCEHSSYRHRRATRVLHDVGDLVSGRPRDIHLTYSVHHCTACDIYFNSDMSDVAVRAPKRPSGQLNAMNACRRRSVLCSSIGICLWPIT